MVAEHLRLSCCEPRGALQRAPRALPHAGAEVSTTEAPMEAESAPVGMSSICSSSFLVFFWILAECLRLSCFLFSTSATYSSVETSLAPSSFSESTTRGQSATESLRFWQNFVKTHYCVNGLYWFDYCGTLPFISKSILQQLTRLLW